MTVQVKFKQYVQWMVTDGGITVQKGVKDHSLHIFRRQANLLLSAVFGSTLAAPGRRASVDVRSSNRSFFLAYHTHEVTIRGFCLTLCYDVMFCL